MRNSVWLAINALLTEIFPTVFFAGYQNVSLVENIFLASKTNFNIPWFFLLMNLSSEIHESMSI